MDAASCLSQTSTEFGSDEPPFDIATLDLEAELAVELGKLIANDHDPELYHVPPTLHQADPSPATSVVDIYNYGLPTATTIAAPSPSQPMFWDVLSSSSYSSPALSSPVPQSPISTPQPTITVTSPTSAPAAAAQAEVEVEAEALVYYFSLLPEKAKTIWVVFFHSRLHSLADFLLCLTNADTTAINNCRELALEANTALSWTATDPLGGQPLYQHKVAFNCPNTTFERAMFRARLVNKASGLALDLGPFSIVSTTSQRTDALARLEQRVTRGSHQRLIVNFKNHPSSKRHHINGKGGKQRNLRGLRFLYDELDKAVQMARM